MAKRQKKNDNQDTPVENDVKVRKGGRVIITPPVDGQVVGAYRYTSKIRYGSISGEVFCKKSKRRKELGLPAIRAIPKDT